MHKMRKSMPAALCAHAVLVVSSRSWACQLHSIRGMAGALMSCLLPRGCSQLQPLARLAS